MQILHRPCLTIDQYIYVVVGNLFTTAGQKKVVIFVAGRTHTSQAKVHMIFIHIIFPLGAWRLPAPAVDLVLLFCAYFALSLSFENCTVPYYLI